MSLEARENMPHVDEGLLHAYLDGELAGAERAEVAAHLTECAECRTRLEEERALVARASELLARAAPPIRAPAAYAPVRRSHAPSWRVPAAWAATVTIAFGIGWYAQGERLDHTLGGPPGQPEARAPASAISDSRPAPAPAPLAKSTPKPKASEPVANASPAAAPPREDAGGQRAAAPMIPARALALRDEAVAWPALDADGAHVLLGQAPALLRGHPVLRMARSPSDDGVVLIEQEWGPGIVLRLYERRAISVEVDATQPSSERARQAPSAQLARRRENLARYVNSLRVEIAGPLAADSLARLLDLVE